MFYSNMNLIFSPTTTSLVIIVSSMETSMISLSVVCPVDEFNYSSSNAIIINSIYTQFSESWEMESFPDPNLYSDLVDKP